MSPADQDGYGIGVRRRKCTGLEEVAPLVSAVYSQHDLLDCADDSSIKLKLLRGGFVLIQGQALRAVRTRFPDHDCTH
jgi:hypothetical protein